MIAFLAGVCAVFFLGLVVLTAFCCAEMKARENAEGEVFDLHDQIRTHLSWARTILGDQHPEVRLICHALERALREGKPVEIVALSRELELLKLNSKGESR